MDSTLSMLLSKGGTGGDGGVHHLPVLSSSEISSIVGWISIWVWVCVYSPQLHENYVLKSGEGLSIVFIVIWLAGDALNMLGAYIEGLLPTMIILAAYYCLCDLALIWQFYYYRKYHEYFHPALNPPSASAVQQTPPTETTALLSNANANAVVIQHEKARQPTMGEEATKCIVGLAFTTLAGVASWYVTWRMAGGHDGVHKAAVSALTIAKHEKQHGWRWDAQVAGWASAILYLSSRFPQIIKNRQTKCEGLSLALFVFAVVGNLTYVASILIKSHARDYVVENLSWLVGSLGTVFLDFVVLAQFITYREERERLARERSEANGSAISVA